MPFPCRVFALTTLLAACGPVDDEPFSWTAGGKAEDSPTALTATTLKLRPVPGTCKPELLVLPRNARVTRRVAYADPLHCLLSEEQLGTWVAVRYRAPGSGELFDGWVHSGYLKQCPMSWHHNKTGSSFFNVTTYFSGKTERDFFNAGKCSKTIQPRGLDRAYCYEFLCHFSGVAGQGTGLAMDGQYISFTRNAPGGHWPKATYEKHYFYQNCEKATFAVTDRVRGSSNRTLIADQSIAVHTCLIPLGASVTLHFPNSDGTMTKKRYSADDTGGMIRGLDIDIYRGAYDLTKAFSASAVFAEWVGVN